MLQGALTVKTVPALWEQRAGLFKEKSVSLASVTEIDSAGIAFLAQWAKAQPEMKLTLSAVPENALRLIKTFKLQPLFELQD